MSWYIHHCGEHSNRTYAQIFEHPYLIDKPDVYGPYPTKEAAIKAAERRGLTPHKLAEPNKEW